MLWLSGKVIEWEYTQNQKICSQGRATF
jgi:hypothetical protein